MTVLNAFIALQAEGNVLLLSAEGIVLLNTWWHINKWAVHLMFDCKVVSPS